MITIHVKKEKSTDGYGLNEYQAMALAQLCKRISWQSCRNNSVDDNEAQAMINATDYLRGALRKAGFDPY